ncbi:MAG TPA: hypothetical protein VF209_03790 [Patescibacteria group bacterium]
MSKWNPETAERRFFTLTEIIRFGEKAGVETLMKTLKIVHPEFAVLLDLKTAEGEYVLWTFIKQIEKQRQRTIEDPSHPRTVVIVFEGIGGVGKTTLLKLMAQFYRYYSNDEVSELFFDEAVDDVKHTMTEEELAKSPAEWDEKIWTKVNISLYRTFSKLLESPVESGSLHLIFSEVPARLPLIVGRQFVRYLAGLQKNDQVKVFIAGIEGDLEVSKTAIAFRNEVSDWQDKIEKSGGILTWDDVDLVSLVREKYNIVITGTEGLPLALANQKISNKVSNMAPGDIINVLREARAQTGREVLDNLPDDIFENLFMSLPGMMIFTSLSTEEKRTLLKNSPELEEIFQRIASKAFFYSMGFSQEAVISAVNKHSGMQVELNLG